MFSKSLEIYISFTQNLGVCKNIVNKRVFNTEIRKGLFYLLKFNLKMNFHNIEYYLLSWNSICKIIKLWWFKIGYDCLIKMEHSQKSNAQNLTPFFHVRHSDWCFFFKEK